MSKRNLIIKWSVFAVVVLTFIVLAILVMAKVNMPVDNFFIEGMKSARSKPLTIIFKIITFIGEFYVLGVLCLVLFILKNKRFALFNLANFGAAMVISLVVKYIVSRPRPAVTLLEESGFSFISAHSMLTMAALGMIIYYAIKHINKKSIKITLIVGLSILIAVVGFSRIYLGVHYFTDVLAGFALGGAVNIISITLYESKFLQNWLKKEPTEQETDKIDTKQ